MVEMETNFQDKHRIKNGSFHVTVPICRQVEDGNGSYVNCFFPCGPPGHPMQGSLCRAPSRAPSRASRRSGPGGLRGS